MMEVSFLEYGHRKRETLGKRKRTLVCLNHFELLNKKWRRESVGFQTHPWGTGYKVECPEMLVCMFSISKTYLWAFGQYLMYRVFCSGLKSPCDRGWGVARSLTAWSWLTQFCEVGSKSLQIICTLSPSPVVWSTQGQFQDWKSSSLRTGGWEWLVWTFGVLCQLTKQYMAKKKKKSILEKVLWRPRSSNSSLF